MAFICGCKGTGRGTYRFPLKCELVTIMELPTRENGYHIVTNKGRFLKNSSCHDCINSIKVGEEYFFQFTENVVKNKILADLLKFN